MKAKDKPKHSPPNPKHTFADTMLLGMSDSGHTDETLAEATGYAADTIYRFRTGKMVPPLRTRKVFMQAFTRKGRLA